MNADLSRPGQWYLPVAVLVLCVFLNVLDVMFADELGYDRAGISHGEVWRLVSGHLVHLNWYHLGLNVIGLLLIWSLVGRQFSQGQWLLIVTGSIALIDTGLWFLAKELEWYVGLSGVLHAMLAAGVIRGALRGRTDLALIGMLLLSKILYELAFGPIPGTESVVGGPVVTAVHLYGVAAACLLLLPLEFLERTGRSQNL